MRAASRRCAATRLRQISLRMAAMCKVKNSSVKPIAIPVLIFGVSASYAAVQDPAPFMPPFFILCAITLFSAVTGPFFAALALRNVMD